VETVDNFLKALPLKDLKPIVPVENLWKTFPVFSTGFLKLKIFHNSSKFSTGFPQKYPQKIVSFPQAFGHFIEFNLVLILI
jgi:hypothetical protein